MPGIRFYIGVTDKNWFQQLSRSNCDEVNFWTPGATTFKALSENELFLFKLHKPDHFIVGGGFFVRYSILPSFLAWSAFGIKNGTQSLDELNNRIISYRKKNNIFEAPQIGCIILTEPFFFNRADWIPAPADWGNSIVRGKTYTTSDSIGANLYAAIQERLSLSTPSPVLVETGQPRYATSLTKHRLGQGGFRISVTDAYQRRCAVSGEKTLPVLEAAHIQPYASDGPHMLQNGLLLRSDIHTLFDGGYITITPDYRVEVSQRLHNDYGNGRDYYKFHGEKLLVLPESMTDYPAKEFIDWHNNHVYLG